MKFKNPMLSVGNMENSKAFYSRVLGLRVIADRGANVTLTGGLNQISKKEKRHETLHCINGIVENKFY